MQELFDRKPQTNLEFAAYKRAYELGFDRGMRWRKSHAKAGLVVECPFAVGSLEEKPWREGFSLGIARGPYRKEDCAFLEDVALGRRKL